MTKRITPWIAGLSAIAAGFALATEAPKIDQARIDAMLKQVQGNIPQQPGVEAPDTAQLTADITRELQTIDILQAAALKAGLDQQPEVKAGLLNAQAQFYAGAYVEYLRNQTEVSDTELRQSYAALTREIKLLPIQFADKAAAEAGLARLKKGLAFEALMKEVNPESSTDTWFSPQQLPPQIAHIAAIMQPGQITGDVVELEGQYFLLKLAGARNSSNAPPFDQVKEQLRDQAKQEKVQEAINKLLEESGLPPLGAAQ
ncbi:peptidyl-prolyl cis-trans isomerase C [Neisseria sp. HSC-16F19]|nr:peptidylprolyl isomerase [Neisseria sp. HSC-16F19]MCP2039718.1 peptidyl-prolyl cis-trans isomerase C [Neisseria sp. HSC-16F19]